MMRLIKSSNKPSVFMKTLHLIERTAKTLPRFWKESPEFISYSKTSTCQLNTTRKLCLRITFLRLELRLRRSNERKASNSLCYIRILSFQINTEKKEMNCSNRQSMAKLCKSMRRLLKETPKT